MKSNKLWKLATLFLLVINIANIEAVLGDSKNKPIYKQSKICGSSGCENSFRTLLTLAKNGSPRAKMLVGLMYMNGMGTEPDSLKAHRYLVAAARAGYEFAQYVIGVHYIEGKVIERDVATGNYWLKKSAMGGYKPAIQLILKNTVGNDSEPHETLAVTEYESEDKVDGHIVVTGEYLTLDSYANYLENNTPYNRKSSTGSRIRGLHYCASPSSACKKIGTKTDFEFDQLFRMIWTAGSTKHQ